MLLEALLAAALLLVQALVANQAPLPTRNSQHVLIVLLVNTRRILVTVRALRAISTVAMGLHESRQAPVMQVISLQMGEKIVMLVLLARAIRYLLVMKSALYVISTVALVLLLLLQVLARPVIPLLTVARLAPLVP